jgi:diketogulonate reductase-like aldo/keto reductase
LIHSPFNAKSDAELQSAWAELEILHASGKARSIGVSNFYPQHLTAILKTAKIKPAINQIEFHAYLQHPQLQKFQKEHNIALAAYGPLVPLTKARPGPVDEVVQRLSAKYNVGEGEILLRWVIEQGIVAITTSGKESRLRGYLKAMEFSLTPEEVREISVEGEKKYFRGYWTTRFPPGDRS